jgi:hypothetical protein
VPTERAARYGAGGYLWVVDGNDRLDDGLAGMIVDTSHAAHHLGAGEPPSARAQAGQSRSEVHLSAPSTPRR